ncbi:cyanophycin synthetase [Clostridium tetani]|uniref:cyanophycin synthetase n=1 Tax=Clostridium tetani TaxID=1513 RepID=UPI002953A6E5|nr:cyanophycin synthetase [Clostridium tetani]BDR71409.1 cyanophycin synthetase [Clostridium tetani]
MKALNYKHFSGRNIYSHRPCIKMEVDLEGFRDISSKDINGFNNKLLEILPGLKKHRCGIDEEGGFAKRLKEGTFLAHICEHTIIELQNLLGIEVSYGKAREIKGDHYYIVYECKYKNTAIEAGNIAIKIINSIITKNEFSLELALNKLNNIFNKEKLGPSTYSIVKAAQKRNIPFIRIGEKSILQLGYGKTSKIVEATIGNDTKCISVDIACDKYLTKEILKNQCIPTPLGGIINNPMDMLIKADRIGYPVVIKPRYGNQGKGVFANLNNEADLLKAYKILSKEYEDIIIEKHIQGKDYRICVVDYKVVAVSERIPPHITGNGKSTIESLIHELNRDCKRGEGHEKPLTKIKIDLKLIDSIGKMGFNINSVPKKGERVFLRENANLSTGGIAIDCTDLICNKNIEMLERASKAVGLDICGIDVCCTDISKPIDGAIIEVNAAPGIRMHEYPYKGQNRDVGEAIVNMIFKDIKEQVPLISVTGTNGKTTTTRLIAHIFDLAGYKTGFTSTGGIYIDGNIIDEGDTTGYNSALTLLTNKEVEAIVLETARGGIIKKGLAYDLADVGVITNITTDHLGLDGIDTLEDLAYVKSLIGEAVKDEGYVVLNADDEMSMKIINRIKSNVILFSKDKNNKFIREYLNKGCFAIYVHEGYMYIEKDNKIIPLININNIKIGLQGKLDYNIENAMAACAVGISMGINPIYIRKAMESFNLDENYIPGRFNIYSFKDRTIILDYGHNAEGYNAVIKGAKKLKHNRLIGVIGAPGDRNDEHLIKLGEIGGKNFDYIYIKEDKHNRTRKKGDVAKLLKTGILNTGFNKDNIKIILKEEDALKEAIKYSKKGDLIVTFFEEFNPLLNIVKKEMENGENKHKSSNEALA